MNDSALFNKLRTELETNPRIRFGLFGIGVIFALILIMNLQDYSQTRQDFLLGQTFDLDDARSIESEEYWRAELEELKKIDQDLRKSLWTGSSENRVKISAQSRLLEMSNNAGLSKLDVKASDFQEVTSMNNHYRLQLLLRGRYKEGVFADFLKELESHRPRFVVDSVDILTSPKIGKLGRIEVMASIYFLKEIQPGVRP
jgi:hypothetical protein